MRYNHLCTHYILRAREGREATAVRPDTVTYHTHARRREGGRLAAAGRGEGSPRGSPDPFVTRPLGRAVPLAAVDRRSRNTTRTITPDNYARQRIIKNYPASKLQYSITCNFDTRHKMTSRFWLFTFNNYDGIVTKEDFGKYFRYVCWQEELGELGTPHIQGYLELTRGVRLAAVKKMLPTAHWEPRRGTQEEAIAYCTKEDTRVAGPYAEGTPSKGQGERADIRTAYEDLKAGMDMKDILEKHTEVFFKYQRGLTAAEVLITPGRDSSHQTDVWYLFGPPGTGKSRYASEVAPLAYWKPANSHWWDGYNGESTVILDDLTAGWFKWANLMQILDRYVCRVEIKGGFKQLRCARIIITSNKAPWELYRDSQGNHKHPIEALLRRISHLVEYFADGTKCDHGCALGYYSGSPNVL